MRARVVLVMGLVLLCPEALRAQETRTLTQMILGVGLPGRDSPSLTPAYTVGLEVSRGGPLALRVTAEYWEDEDADYSSNAYRLSRTGGIQLLGVRTFGTRRVQPYLLAGAGVYTTHSRGVGHRFALTDSGFIATQSFLYDQRDLLPTMIWGAGASVRLRSTRVFIESKLPLYHSGTIKMGPQSPLVIGIRF